MSFVIDTFHAEYQLKERKIDKQWIEEAIRSPNIIKHIGNKSYAIKKIGSKTLKVVYVKQRYIKIITIYWI